MSSTVIALLTKYQSPAWFLSCPKHSLLVGTFTCRASKSIHYSGAASLVDSLIPGVIMSLWVFLEAMLMITNAIAILNEDRFLVPHGWGFSEMSSGRVSALKSQIIGLLHAVQYLRIPLIALNTITVFLKLIFG